MVDGSSLLAVLVPAAASVAGRGPVGIEMRMRWRGARESMMLRPGPSYSPAAYFSADYDRYTDFARSKAVRQRDVAFRVGLRVGLLL
jgi:hypothetical protein